MGRDGKSEKYRGKVSGLRGRLGMGKGGKGREGDGCHGGGGEGGECGLKDIRSSPI